jgi:hypothetical protein
MKRITLAVLMMSCSAISYAGDADNIQACVKRASDFTGLKLSEFDASYEGNIFSQSIAKWKNAYCEVKMGNVYNLQINGKQVIYNGYAGKESFDLNAALNSKTESAINQLRSRIAILEQRMGQVSAGLKMPKPDHAGLTRYVDEGIEKSIGVQRQPNGPASPVRQDVPRKKEEPIEMRVTAPQPMPSQAVPKQPESQKEVRQPASLISSEEVESVIRGSDDFSNYQQIFIPATAKLIENGTCNLAELKEMGGWVKSQSHKNQPVYFTYCGGMTIGNRIYIDVSSGNVFR